MRRVSCCIVLVLMLCFGGAAFAQDTAMTVPCGDLSAEDCAILTNAQTASATLDSALYDFNFDLTVAGIPGMNAPLNFNLTGSGAFSGLAGLQELASGMDMTDMSDMAAMQDQLGEYVAELFGSFNGDLNLTLTVPEALMEDAPPNTPNSLTLQARLVDGVGYLNMDTLAPFLGDMDEMELSGWYGIDLVELMDAAMDEMPSDLLSSGTTFTMPNDAMLDYAAAFSDPEFLDSFMTVSRTDDGSGETAVFAFDLDFGGLMSNAAFRDMLEAQMESQMDMMDTSLNDEEMGAVMAMMSQMFKGMTMTMTEEIGLEDGYLHSLTGSLDIDTTGMMAAMSEIDGSTSNMDFAPTVSVNFALNYSSFNSAPAVTAPEDATIVPLSTIFGGMMGGMGDMSMSGSGASAMEMTPTPTPSS